MNLVSFSIKTKGTFLIMDFAIPISAGQRSHWNCFKQSFAMHSPCAHILSLSITSFTVAVKRGFCV
jgi:hypothetical protein